MKQTIKKSIVSGVVFSMTVFMFGFTYAVWNGLNADDGDTLTSAKWNELVDKLDGVFTDGSGNVGIGTTSPQAKLHVTGGETILEQEAWITPTFQNSWVNYGSVFSTAGYYRDSLGIVHLKGLVKSGVVGSSSCIFTLPVGYRSSEEHIFPVLTSNAIGRIDITSNGCIEAHTGSNAWFSLSNISFRAEQ